MLKKVLAELGNIRPVNEPAVWSLYTPLHAHLTKIVGHFEFRCFVRIHRAGRIQSVPRVTTGNPPPHTTARREWPFPRNWIKRAPKTPSCPAPRLCIGPYSLV